MKCRALLLVSLFLCIQETKAQGWQWEHNFLTNSAENFNAMTADSEGNVVVGFQFNNLLQIGSYSFQTNPVEDVCVVKYDSLGNLLWAQAFGGLYWDQINGMACDSAGNVFVVGHFTAELFYYDTSFVGSTGRDIFIMRINADGTFGWLQTGSNVWDEEATDVVVTPEGDIIVSGMANNTSVIGGMDLISELPNVFMQDFIAKFSNSGEPLWIRSAGATDYNSNTYSRSCLALGLDGSIHIGIPRSGGLNFAGQVTEGPANSNTVILKWDSEGNPLWGWVGLSDGNDFLRDIAVDDQGRVYSAISTVMSSSFGGEPFTVTPGDWGIVFIRLLEDGSEDRYWLATGARRSDVFTSFRTPDNRIWFGGMQRYETSFPFAQVTAGTVNDRQGFLCSFDANTDEFTEFSRVHGIGWQYIYGGCASMDGKLYFGGDISGSIGTPVYFGIQDELTDEMYIQGKTLPYVGRYNSAGCHTNPEIIQFESVEFCDGSFVEIGPDIPTFAFEWSNGTSQVLQVSEQGIYDLQAITMEGCIVRDTVLAEVETAPQLNWVLQTITCNGANDGAITMDATGLNPPYTFTWNGSIVDSPLEGISSGLYVLQAQSAGGCITSAEIEITDPEPLSIEYSMNYNEDTGQGWIAIDAISGGTPPYISYWPQFPQAADSLLDVSLGSYTLLVSDANGCEQEFSVTLITDVPDVNVLNVECYPVPASDYIIISADESFRWKLLDDTGRILMSEARSQVEHRIRLTTLSAGRYFFQLHGESGVLHTLKVVKQ
jgi:hypothetical protein